MKQTSFRPQTIFSLFYFNIQSNFFKRNTNDFNVAQHFGSKTEFSREREKIFT
jgi:hypothetical protein